MLKAIPMPGTNRSLADPEIRHELQTAHERHANDRRALQEEIERIYQERSFRPWNSCLPVLARSATAATINRCPLPSLSQRQALGHRRDGQLGDEDRQHSSARLDR